jgi:hypothetical protein
MYSLLYRATNARSPDDCPKFFRPATGGDDTVEFNVTYSEFAGGQYVGPCAGGAQKAFACQKTPDTRSADDPHVVINLNRCQDFDQLSHRDGIHQIVSRFLERFRYMCPLLFSCVFPS